MTDAKSSSLENTENQQKWSQLAKRAAIDEKLKEQLLTDAAPALQAEGIALPEGSRVRVVEENGRLNCVIETPVGVSAAAAGELSGSDLNNIQQLSEEALNKVVGGTKAVKPKANSGGTESYMTYTMTEVFITSVS